MIGGMLPLALALGPGSEGQSPMAHAVIGGIITSTLLTLVVVPVLFTYMDTLGSKAMRRMKGTDSAPQQPGGSSAAPVPSAKAGND
jgi:HAE1 family hydrophobic/amphiphilic exporter-1